MNFIPVTSDGKICLENLESKIQSLSFTEHFHLKEKIRSCPVRVYFIGRSPMISGIQSEDVASQHLVEQIHQSWAYLNDFQNGQYARAEHNYFLRQNLIRTSQNYFQSNIILYKIKWNFQVPSYVILVRERDLHLLDPLELRPLCLMWQMDQGKIPFMPVE